MAIEGQKFLNTWGSFPFGRSRLEVRQIVMWMGIAVWAGWTWAKTAGFPALIALAYNATFVIPLMIVSRANTTIPLATTGTITLCGASMMGIAGLVGVTLQNSLGANNVFLPFLTGTLEETLKLLPVVILLWRGRKFSSYTIGTTDILLLGIACGAGFGVVEDAFMHAAAWQSDVRWLPSTEVINGRMIAGDSIWTGLAAGTIGIAFMMRHRTGWILLAPVGLLWAMLDHITYNYASTRPDLSGTILNWITGNGYLTIALFIACFSAAFLLDRFILFKILPKVSEFKIPSSKEASESLENVWEFVLDRRRLAYAYYKYSHRTGEAQRAPAMVVAILMQHLINCHKVKVQPMKDLIEEGAPLFEPQAYETQLLTQGPQLAATIVEPKLIAAQSQKSSALRIDGLDLPERYEILSTLSQGGMGVIYKARHVMTDAKVAVKTLHAHLAKEQTHILRFDQEAKAASALKHPNLVVIHDYGVTPSNVPFIVMDMIEGTNLQDQIRQNGPLTLERFCNIFIQASDALAHAHKRGVIHRDIKPSNMILGASDDGKDFVRIVDFGIAKVIANDALTTQELTRTGDLVGSPLYMSPEQCLGSALDARSDIYSLGCVMYESITGKTPFLGQNSVQTIFKHIHEMPIRPQIVRPDFKFPQELEQLLFRTLQKDPAARYAAMEDLRRDLSFIQERYNLSTSRSPQTPL